MTFKELNLPVEIKEKEVKITDEVSIGVSQYLPIEKKGELITFVANSAMDAKTGCFSPLRVEIYFALGVVKYYSTLDYDDVLLTDAGELYDKLEINGIFDEIMQAIPEDELDFLHSLVIETIEDLARYNNSFAGTLGAMSQESMDLDSQLSGILEKVKSKEGLELLSTIKDMGVSN